MTNGLSAFFAVAPEKVDPAAKLWPAIQPSTAKADLGTRMWASLRRMPAAAEVNGPAVPGALHADALADIDSLMIATSTLNAAAASEIDTLTVNPFYAQRHDPSCDRSDLARVAAASSAASRDAAAASPIAAAVVAVVSDQNAATAAQPQYRQSRSDALAEAAWIRENAAALGGGTAPEVVAARNVFAASARRLMSGGGGAGGVTPKTMTPFSGPGALAVGGEGGGVTAAKTPMGSPLVQQARAQSVSFRPSPAKTGMSPLVSQPPISSSVQRGMPPSLGATPRESPRASGTSADPQASQPSPRSIKSETTGNSPVILGTTDAHHHLSFRDAISNGQSTSTLLRLISSSRGRSRSSSYAKGAAGAQEEAGVSVAPESLVEPARAAVRSEASTNLPPAWRVVTEPDGSSYFFNTVTGASSWQSPVLPEGTVSVMAAPPS